MGTQTELTLEEQSKQLQKDFDTMQQEDDMKQT
jgi:hypothetical protein